MDNNSLKIYRLLGLILGPVIFLLLLLMARGIGENNGGISPTALKVAGMALWMVIWWITEAVPIPATALLPMVILPILGIFSMAEATAGYAHRLIYVFFGGFLIALALEKWNLHRRIALLMVGMLGTSTQMIILGFILTTGLLSMWIANTATTMMILPIAMAVLNEITPLLKSSLPDNSAEKGIGKLRIALVLSIAYSASIGGMATLIGTPANTVFAGVLQELTGREVSFAEWMSLGVPISLVGLAVLWLYMIIHFRLSAKKISGAGEFIQSEIRKLGSMNGPERSVLVIFCLAAFLWITRRWLLKPIFPKVDDAVIAMTGALALFVIPSSIREYKFVMDWETAKKLPWGVLLLFGGGFTLASAFQKSGLSAWIGGLLSGFNNIPFVLILLIIITMVTFMTELTSNTASTTLLLPIIYSVAVALNMEPVSLMAATALAASCAFMLPVATPPNAIVFGSGYVTIPQMVKTGFAVNLIFIIIITVAMLIIPI